MKRYLISFLIAAGCALSVPTIACASTLTLAPTLLFEDTFGGNALDARRWTTTYPWCDPARPCPGSPPLDRESYAAKSVSVDDGLFLTASHLSGAHYDSGIVTTGGVWSPYKAPTFSFQYGYAEMRGTFPVGLHMWPAFWLLAVTHNSPAEIDIVEGQGAVPATDFMTLHYAITASRNGSAQGTYVAPESLQGTTHTYAVDWQPGYVTWYLDGVARFRYTNTRYIPRQRMYVLVDLAVGGWVSTWNGVPGPGDVFPATMHVDYVRVWNRKPA